MVPLVPNSGELDAHVQCPPSLSFTKNSGSVGKGDEKPNHPLAAVTSFLQQTIHWSICNKIGGKNSWELEISQATRDPQLLIHAKPL